MSIDDKINLTPFQSEKNKQLPVKKIVNTKAISSFYGQLLFKLVNHYKPNTLLELGTSLGIATLYQATPNPHVPLISLEDKTPIALKTEAFFKKLGTKNITLFKGQFEENLPKALQQLKTVHHVYFNDFWGTSPTLSYFEQCLNFISKETIFIFNLPYQSKESVEFWNKIKQHKKVKLSIDLYNLGLLFFRSEQKEVTHLKLIKSWKKPWAVI